MKGAFFETLVKLGMMTECHNQVVETRCIHWLDILMEFVDQSKKPVVRFLLDPMGVVEVDLVEFFEEQVVGHEVGEEFIDLVVASQFLTAVEEVGSDDGFDEMSVVVVSLEGNALGSELPSERVVDECVELRFDAVMENLLACCGFRRQTSDDLRFHFASHAGPLAVAEIVPA